MACGSCGTKGPDGKPAGCQSNGGCSSGGCNRLNVFDWLAGLPLHDGAKPYPIIEVSFQEGSRKEFYRNNTAHLFEKGEAVTVEGGNGGWDVGHISLTGELVKLQMKKHGVKDTPELKKILRPATSEDLDSHWAQRAREPEIMTQSRAMSRAFNLEMKIAQVEMQADGKRATFYYTADTRVDFRDLIRQMATEFRTKVDMRQIGARQETGKIGGIGSCGRELCCSTWLTDFKTVNTAAARYQNLSINQTKLSGQCGRLKCCLNYELDTYMDGLKAFPTQGADKLQMATGIAFLQKRDIFKNLMWYSFASSSKQYPLTPERVAEIIALNKDGQKPEDLGAIEVLTRSERAAGGVDEDFVNDVGQISLRALERSRRKSKSKGKASGPQGGREGGEGAKPGRLQTRQLQPVAPEGKQSGNRPQGRRGGENNGQKAQQPQQQKPQSPKPQQGGGGGKPAEAAGGEAGAKNQSRRRGRGRGGNGATGSGGEGSGQATT